jgi:PAS domain S-box-containing protein
MFQTIKSKIVLSYSVLVILTLIVAIIAIFQFSNIDRTIDIVLKRNYRNVVWVEGLLESIERQNNAQLYILSNETPTGERIFKEYKNTFSAIMGNLRNSYVKNQDRRNIIDTMNLYFEFYIFATDSLTKIVKTGKKDLAQAFYFNTLEPVFQVLREKCFILLEKNQEDMEQTFSLAKEITTGSILIVLIASILSVAFATFAVWLFSQYLIQPLLKLINTIQQIRGGKLDFKLEPPSGDEIGELTEELKMMMNRLQRYESMNIDLIIAEKKKSESIVESISEAIIVTDKKNNIILINKIAEEIFDVTIETALNKNIKEVISNNKIFDWIQKVIETKKPLSVDTTPYLALGKEEDKKYYRPKLTPMLSATGDVLGVVTILQDVTRFKELDRLKSDFMATISHEFRTPLTSISMSIDILNQEILGPLSQKQKELLESTNEDLKRLRKMAKELLELSRLEAGREIVKKEFSSINEIVEFTLKPLWLPFEDKEVSLNINIENDLPNIFVDKSQISTVLTNILNNALKYTNPGGTVSLEVKRIDENILFKITDTGRGIPEEHQTMIFDKFYQFKESVETSPGSVGLGLAISKEIVESYNGKIWVESKLGKGSSFMFTIPIKS